MKPQPTQSKLKTYGTIAIVVLVFVLVYFYVSGGSPSSSTLTQGSGDGAIGSSELSLLNQVNSLKIDTTLFSDPAFLSLQDYSVAITPENVGRPNPFAPLSGEAVPTSAAPATSK